MGRGILCGVKIPVVFFWRCVAETRDVVVDAMVYSASSFLFSSIFN